MANGGAVFAPLGRLVPSVLHTPQLKANGGLHCPARGMENNVLAVSMVARLTCFGLQFIQKFKHVWHSSTQCWYDFIQATTVHCQSPLSIEHRPYEPLKYELSLADSPWLSSSQIISLMGVTECQLMWLCRQLLLC